MNFFYVIRIEQMFSRLPIEIIEEILAYTELDEIKLNG